MEQLIHITVDSVKLEGMLDIPPDAIGLVLFAHGSGSSRLSPRNNAVARGLRDAKLATLLIDLLSANEDLDYESRFDIALLSKRLVEIIHWLKRNESTRELPLGLFGASTGAAAALMAARECSKDVKAVVSRGGRPDLAPRALPLLTTPVLLLVGGDDTEVIELNRLAYNALRGTRELKIIPGATHLFEEPGTLQEVTRFATQWFLKYASEVPVHAAHQV